MKNVYQRAKGLEGRCKVMSTTKQPIWKLVANLGDASPADYGGFFVFVDKTGVYGPQAEVYEPNEEAGTGGVMSSFPLETVLNEWFMDAACIGRPADEFKAELESGDPVRIACIYKDLVSYFGAYEFDPYPVTLTESKAQERYTQPLYQDVVRIVDKKG